MTRRSQSRLLEAPVNRVGDRLGSVLLDVVGRVVQLDDLVIRKRRTGFGKNLLGSKGGILHPPYEHDRFGPEQPRDIFFQAANSGSALSICRGNSATPTRASGVGCTLR
jgi:hypothetical protein